LLAMEVLATWSSPCACGCARRLGLVGVAGGVRLWLVCVRLADLAVRG
jgi:hypothetical protein